MAEQTYNTPRMTDKEVLSALYMVTSQLTSNNPNVQATIDLNPGPTVSIPLKDFKDNPNISPVLDANSILFRSVSIAIQNPSVSITHRNNATLASVSVSLGNNPPINIAVNALVSLHRHFPPFERNEALDKLLGDELAEFYRKREAGLLRLEALTQKLIEDNEQYRTHLDIQIEKTDQQLREKFKADHEALKTEYEQKLHAIELREKNLEKRTKELDDRSGKHARRQNHKEMKELIRQRGQLFSLTKQTRRKRYFIHALFIALIGFLVWMLALALPRLGDTTQQYYAFFLVKISLLSIATVATLIYYIRWNDNWFAQHAEEEFALKRFELDIDRASWIAEMALEWKDEEERQLPPELLNAFTSNLFGKKNEAKKANHPYEDFMSLLMGASTEMNIPIPPNGNMKITRKGMQEIMKSAKASETE